ncbi:hypothetical protein MBANPS3_002562 [Mucor bainieri]
MPIGWTEEHCKGKLRGFFLYVDWITPKDNESKLVMIPFIQAFMEFRKNYPLDKERQHFDRERTSVLFSMHQVHWKDRINFSYTFFKMQSAKELIAVSKTLACSDFLLVPSIISTKCIDLVSSKNVTYNAFKKIIARIQDKDPKCVSDENTFKKDDPAWILALYMSDISENMLLWGHRNLKEFLSTKASIEEHQLQGLEKWTCGQLVAALYEDIDLKGYFNLVSDFFKEAVGTLDKDVVARDSPDGIQHIILYSDLPLDVSPCIQHVLVEENIIQPNNKVFKVHPEFVTRFAMQQSYKMIQIANAVLPPIIVQDRDQDGTALKTHNKPVDSSIAPNTFYVQANVTETQISFILNKVIEAQSSKTGIDLFTIQERSIEIENIAKTASDLL